MASSSRKRTLIPMHSMEMEHGRGIELERIETGQEQNMGEHVLQAHRDDHYMFFLQDSGETNLMLDFQPVKIRDNMIGFVLPGQVHAYAPGVQQAAGWFLAINTSLIDAPYRAVFENKLLERQVMKVQDPELLADCLALLYRVMQGGGEHYPLTVVRHLLNGFLGMASAAFSRVADAPGRPVGRLTAIAAEFRELVAKRLITHKSPAAYAALLNISPTYLNEAVKAQTGFPATYWIQQETVLETGRLLYYTDLTVKEIAHRLGFEDHAYFSRLFRKVMGMTALAFRSKYRELSNHHL